MRNYTNAEFAQNRLYLEALSEQYPTVRATAAEIINLRAILNLPKGTEHFLSDIHGEYESFRHILNNGSGTIREKIDALFKDSLPLHERAELATLIYYPLPKLKEILANVHDKDEYYRITLFRLLRICSLVASKYTRSKVRKALPASYAYILDELLYSNSVNNQNRDAYQENIITSIIDLGQAEPLIAALSSTIKRLIVDQLHIVGDIFDRGSRPDIVVDDLMAYHRVDIQWGNHDILWMGAASGSPVCIANALNNAFSYGNLDTIEIGYGINLRPLAQFAAETYSNTDVSCFMPKEEGDTLSYTANSPTLVAGMHKAIAVMLFKLEGDVIARNPDFNMQDRLLLGNVDYRNGTVKLGDKAYPLKDRDFPTVDPAHPYQLTEKEREVIKQLKMAFRHSEKLQHHVDFLFAKGGLYKCCNNNLLFHGCIPMNEDGTLMDLTITGQPLHGKGLLDAIERIVRSGYLAPADSHERTRANDFMWFLWCGRHSPLFGRDRMCTFERLLIDDPQTHVEARNPYYQLYDNEAACLRILREFGYDNPHSHIINGHIPVNRLKGESPIKAGGRLIVIDGGFCHSYQTKTGSAGYTLVYNSYCMRIISHEPFEGTANAISQNRDISSSTVIFDVMENRIPVSQTDDGALIKQRIEGLTMLLAAYQNGFLKELEQ
jgi:fructose-1,6-bisphosphatase-3